MDSLTSLSTVTLPYCHLLRLRKTVLVEEAYTYLVDQMLWRFTNVDPTTPQTISIAGNGRHRISTSNNQLLIEDEIEDF